MPEFPELYALDVARAVERLRAAAQQELRPLHALVGADQTRADELDLFEMTTYRAGVMLLGPELPSLRVWLDRQDADYQEALTGERGGLSVPAELTPASPDEADLVAQLRAVSGGRTRTLITSRPPSSLPVIPLDDGRIELEAEEEGGWPSVPPPPVWPAVDEAEASG